MAAFIVVDASIAGAWLLLSPTASMHSLFSPRSTPGGSLRWPLIALRKSCFRVCQKKTLPLPVGAAITSSDAWLRFLDVVTSPIELLNSDELHERAWQMAFGARLTTHDALYLALAERWGAELWTLDDLLAVRGTSVYPAVYDLRTTAFPY